MSIRLSKKRSEARKKKEIMTAERNGNIAGVLDMVVIEFSMLLLKNRLPKLLLSKVTLALVIYHCY